MFKSQTQPLCRWCGKRIAKRTNHRPVGRIGTYDFDRPTTVEDCKKLTNEQIVSVKYHYETDTNYDRTGRRTIYSYNTWDGQSYADEYFCNGEHARWFGYAAAEKGLAMPAYNKAMKLPDKIGG